MATSITFPTPLPLVNRRHRITSVATREARNEALRRHPSAQARQNPSSFVVSCGDCSLQNTSACDDCVVTFVCGSSVALVAEEARALSLFQSVGLLPPSQHTELPQAVCGT